MCGLAERFLHSGQQLPSNGDNGARNEGVSIAIDEKPTAAWRTAGEAWEAVSSSIVTATMLKAHKVISEWHASRCQSGYIIHWQHWSE